MTRSLSILLFAVLVFGNASKTHAAVIIFHTQLSGPAEAPPNASPGIGFAQIDLDTTLNTMRLRTTFSGLIAPVTVAHIHSATAVAGTGTAGVATTVPSFAGFPSGVTSGTFDNTLDLTLASSYNPSFVTVNGSISGAQAALTSGLLNGKAYLNIHTTTFPGGEIRGFFSPVPEPTSMMLMALGVPVLAMMARRRRTVSM